jgi:diguanylate cyclase (GGDEF)-like protein
MPGSPAQRPDADLAVQLERLAAVLRRPAESLQLAATGNAAGCRDALERQFAGASAGLSRAVSAVLAADPGGTPLEDEPTEGLFIELAISRAAPIDEIIRHCLCWRVEVNSEARSAAIDLGLAPPALDGVLGVIEQVFDVTVIKICEAVEFERRKADEHLRFLATHDALTGLPNRSLIQQRLATSPMRSRRTGTRRALIFIDLDNFKLVNDTLGHGVGDDLLRLVTARLREIIRERDAIGRLGGDEFVVILDEATGSHAPDLIAQRLLETLREPFILADGKARLRVTASIGVASSDGCSAETLLRDADVAMYRAKAGGKDRYELAQRAAAPLGDGAAAAHAIKQA